MRRELETFFWEIQTICLVNICLYYPFSVLTLELWAQKVHCLAGEQSILKFVLNFPQRQHFLIRFSQKIKFISGLFKSFNLKAVLQQKKKPKSFYVKETRLQMWLNFRWVCRRFCSFCSRWILNVLSPSCGDTKQELINLSRGRFFCFGTYELGSNARRI